MSIRSAVLAGKWYPRDARELRSSIESYLAMPQGLISDVHSPCAFEEKDNPGAIRAIVVPHAGHSWSGPTAAAAYARLPRATYKRVFILCPNHRVPICGMVSSSADSFQTPLGDVGIDTEMIAKLRQAGIVRIDDGAHRHEHAVEIQLPFLQVALGRAMCHSKKPSSSGYSSEIAQSVEFSYSDENPGASESRESTSSDCDRFCVGFKIIPIIVGDIDDEISAHFAQFYEAHCGAETLLVVSSDFLHYGENYGYVPFGAPVQENIGRYDMKTVAAFATLDGASFDEYAQENPHAACGLNALRIAAHVFDGARHTVCQYAYDTSGRRSGDDDMSVSYAALSICEKEAGCEGVKQTRDSRREIARNGEEKDSGERADFSRQTGDDALTAADRAIAHEIVRRALSEAVAHQGETPFPDDETRVRRAPFDKRYGVFVTLHEACGRLRGCIGNILPVTTLGAGLWERAQDAAINDPRFDPVRPDELPSLLVEISVLTPPADVSSAQDIVIGKHGILLKKGFRSAVFLPQVAPEQGWDLETTLSHLSLKAGLSPNAWREGAKFQVFEAQVF